MASDPRYDVCSTHEAELTGLTGWPALIVHIPSIAWFYYAAAHGTESPLHHPHLFEQVRGFITAHIVGKTILGAEFVRCR